MIKVITKFQLRERACNQLPMIELRTSKPTAGHHLKVVMTKMHDGKACAVLTKLTMKTRRAALRIIHSMIKAMTIMITMAHHHTTITSIAMLIRVVLRLIPIAIITMIMVVAQMQQIRISKTLILIDTSH